MTTEIGERDWEEWSETFWQALQTQGEVETKSESSIKLYAPNKQPTTITYYRKFDPKVHDHTNPFHAPVTEAKSLYQGGFPRSGKHIEMSLKGSDVTYETGDYLAVWPKNLDTHVEALGTRLGLDINQYFSIAKDSILLENFPPCFPNPITIRETFSQYCDLTLPPKRFTIQCLAPFATQKEEREKLERLADAKQTTQADYEAQFYNKDFATILNDFPSVKLTLQEALELIPSARFRYYSISSASQQFPDSVHVTMCRKSVGPPDNCKISLCATYLDQLKAGDLCPIHVTKSEFKLPPKELKLPIIMVAVGTGYAPMRGFLQQRVLEENHENMLFCGYYHKNQDFIYREEVEQLYVPTSLLLCFFQQSLKCIFPFGYGIDAWATGFQSSQDTSESPRPPDQPGSGKYKREVSISPSPHWSPNQFQGSFRVFTSYLYCLLS